jgi:hypothetical protein
LEGDEAAAAGGDSPSSDGRHHVLRLGSRMQTRTLLANAGAQAHGIVRGEVAMRCIILLCCCAHQVVPALYGVLEKQLAN